MSKETIKTKILANLAGHGSQVDISGKLTEILLELADSAMATPVSDITAIPGETLDKFSVGDKVAKKTGTAEHLYVVSYKDAENGGLCLTYTDAENVETVAYDHTESGWVLNGVTKTHIGA